MTVDELKMFKKMTDRDSFFAEFKEQQAFEFTFNGAFGYIGHNEFVYAYRIR